MKHNDNRVVSLVDTPDTLHLVLPEPPRDGSPDFIAGEDITAGCTGGP